MPSRRFLLAFRRNSWEKSKKIKKPVDNDLSLCYIMQNSHNKPHVKGLVMTQDNLIDSGSGPVFQTTVEKFGDWELHYPDSLLEIWDIWHNSEQFSQNASLHSTLDSFTKIKWEDVQKEDYEIGFTGYLSFGDYLMRRLNKLQTTMVNLLHAEKDYLNPVGEVRRRRAKSEFKASRFQDVDIEKEVLLLFREIPEDYQKDRDDDDSSHEIKRIPPSRERLESFTCQKYLRNAIRRFLNLKYYPSEVDFDSKIRDAARELIKAKRVELKTDVFLRKKAEAQIELEDAEGMDEVHDNAGIRFYSWSLLKLVDAPDKRAADSNYTLRRGKIPMFKPRHGNKVSIISPSDAKELVEKLLYVFDGWTGFPQLKKAAWNHVRNSEQFVSIESVDKHIGKETHIVFPDFDDEDIKQMIEDPDLSQRSDEIWIDICKNIDDTMFFCLYILPTDYGEILGFTKRSNPPKLEDFGKTSTLSDKKTRSITSIEKRIRQIIQESLEIDYEGRSKSFVGQGEEMMNLNQMADSPQPEKDGTEVGETELATACAKKFPKGRFLIPMKGIHNWAEVMSRMVKLYDCKKSSKQNKSKDAKQTHASECLDLPENFSNLPPPEKQKAGYRILTRCAEKGAVLLLLDNLNDMDLISETGLQDLTGPDGLPENLHLYATRTWEKREIETQTLPEIEKIKDCDMLVSFFKISGNGNTFSFAKYLMADGKLVLDVISEKDRPESEKIQEIEQEYADLQEFNLETKQSQIMDEQTPEVVRTEESRMIVKKILSNLSGRCTKNGFNPETGKITPPQENADRTTQTTN